MSQTLLVVAAALYNKKGEILLAQRPDGKSMAGLWEFPGGKLEAGETPEAALARELEEELGIVADPLAFEPITFASHAYETFHLLMPLYALYEWQGALIPREGQAIEWVKPDRLFDYPAPPADLPLFDVLAALG